MNYYERHIGDYIRDTVSLTMLEDGAYNRLLDQYYQSERPLPVDKKEIYRLARATTAPERKAVDYVLQRYFEVTAEGYRQKRCDEVIEQFWERDQGKESKRENDRERQRRARERRAQLFDELRAHGVVPAFNTPTRELQAQLSRVTERDESKNVTRDNTATQTPDTIGKTPHTPQGGNGRQVDIVGKPKRSAIGLPAYLKACKQQGVKPIAEDDTVFAYAEQAGIPLEFLRLHWLEFKARYSLPDAKRYKDWPAVHRKSVRGNWFKLWYIAGDGNVVLTTVGEQARRVHAEAA